MKMFRSLGVLLLAMAALLLLSCGNPNSDTSGYLTIGTPTVGSASCGMQTVQATVTFTPPTGTVPNGVQVVVSESLNGTLENRQTETLGSNTSFTMTYEVTQTLNAGASYFAVSAAIGSMNAGTAVIIPAFTNNSGC